jgi:hypothetical protein
MKKCSILFIIITVLIIFKKFFSRLKSGTNIVDENTIALEIFDELEDTGFKIPDNKKILNG